MDVFEEWGAVRAFKTEGGVIELFDLFPAVRVHESTGTIPYRFVTDGCRD
jgi:hypothetical protein